MSSDSFPTRFTCLPPARRRGVTIDARSDSRQNPCNPCHPWIKIRGMTPRLTIAIMLLVAGAMFGPFPAAGDQRSLRIV